jgi:hypothetical protein
MVAVLSFEMSSHFYQTQWCHISDGSIFHDIPLSQAQLKINATPSPPLPLYKYNRMENRVSEAPTFQRNLVPVSFGICQHLHNKLHGTEDCELNYVGAQCGAVLQRRIYIQLCNSYSLLAEIRYKSHLHVIIFLMYENK